eukprot:NODE_3211_length_1009_cov_30.512472_g3065_i0.p1 GENE.NODE_3211_length_1009_cov_30.512472_g3065_i0~~NODE_3211_length_1009_cov_30.512472_g3065_i0.p1  ORF type:complete len:297 (+),score=69.45 NODE_3211_length_1009_cov_30.512472_g3065_i0:80-970(+)
MSWLRHIRGIARLSTATRNRTELRETDFQYCEDIVKKADYEAWLVGQYFKGHQKAYYTLYALHTELNYIRLKADSREPQQKRLLFWQTTIPQLFEGQIEATPIHRALRDVIQSYHLEKLHLRRMVDARLKILDASQPTVRLLGYYLDGVSTSLLALLLQCLNIKDADTEHAVAHLGKALGIVHVLRFSPLLMHQRTTFFPADICAKEGVSEEDIYTGQPSEKLNRLVFQMANEAHQHLQQARTFSTPSAARPVLLHSAICAAYLQRLQKCQFNIHDDRLLNYGARVAFLWKLMRHN